jgi:hypothetical protein
LGFDAEHGVHLSYRFGEPTAISPQKRQHEMAVRVTWWWM